jgi:hypothetical protein
MVGVSIRTVGFVQAIGAMRALGAAGEAVNGPLATFGSRLPYARPIEKNEFLSGPRKGQIARRAGPARMFERGAADAQQLARQILPGAIVRGPAAVGAAKRRIRDYGLERIRKDTPVRSGKLRDSVSNLERPGIR